MSASFSVFGDFASIAAFTEAMNAFLSKVPAGWASIESAFAALAWPVTSSVGASAASCASFAFDAAGGCARLALANVFTFFVTCLNAGSPSGATPGGLAGGWSSWSPDRAAGSGAGAGPPLIAGAGGAAPGPPPTGLAPFAAALPSGLLAGTGFLGGTGFFAGTAPGPNPVVVTASADGGGRMPSRSTGMPSPFAAFSPFSSVSTSGSSLRTSRSPASRSDRASSPGNLIRAAIRALTAELPAARCIAIRARAPPAGPGRPPPALRLPFARASPTAARAASAVWRAPPMVRGSPMRDRRTSGGQAPPRARPRARTGRNLLRGRCLES